MQEKKSIKGLRDNGNTKFVNTHDTDDHDDESYESDIEMEDKPNPNINESGEEGSNSDDEDEPVQDLAKEVIEHMARGPVAYIFLAGCRLGQRARINGK